MYVRTSNSARFKLLHYHHINNVYFLPALKFGDTKHKKDHNKSTRCKLHLQILSNVDFTFQDARMESNWPSLDHYIISLSTQLRKLMYLVV